LISVKATIKFFCLFVLVYGLMMVAWPAIGAIYSKFYRATGEFLFGSFGSRGIVRFYQSEKNRDDIYIVAFDKNRTQGNGKVNESQSHNIHYGDYMHISFLTALIMAVSLPLKRRIFALVWGWIFMHIFIIFKMVIIILCLFSGKRLSLLVLSPFWRDVVVTTNQVAVRDLTTSFVIAFFVWVLVSFRREDWQRITAMQGRGGKK